MLKRLALSSRCKTFMKIFCFGHVIENTTYFPDVETTLKQRRFSTSILCREIDVEITLIYGWSTSRPKFNQISTSKRRRVFTGTLKLTRYSLNAYIICKTANSLTLEKVDHRIFTPILFFRPRQSEQAEELRFISFNF